MPSPDCGFWRDPENVQKALDTIDVQPTITAHPTEAKRVTVLEIHRRIYLKLYELESPRWTPRERKALVDLLRNEIDMLWMTGEIRIEKPTVESEISWGLHFFREALFDRTASLCDLMECALQRHYPELPSRVRPPLRFSSWIGGDRDGNPFVTVATTRNALTENRKAAVERLDKRLTDLVQLISLSDNEVSFSAEFPARLAQQLEACGQGESIGAQSAGTLPPVLQCPAASPEGNCRGQSPFAMWPNSSPNLPMPSRRSLM